MNAADDDEDEETQAFRATARLQASEDVPPFYPYSGTEEERNRISRVDDSLFLTNWRGVEQLAEMQKLGITHVLNVNGGEEDNKYVGSFEYMNIDDVTDDEDQAMKLKGHFEAANTFIDAAVAGGGKAVVHCAAGISRSTTIVLAYLMHHHGISLLDAFTQVYSSRRVVWPNNGFMARLIELESATTGTSTIDLEVYTRWGNFDSQAYAAARVVDRGGHGYS